MKSSEDSARKGLNKIGSEPHSIVEDQRQTLKRPERLNSDDDANLISSSASRGTGGARIKGLAANAGPNT